MNTTKIDPGKGWRLLEEGEPLMEGDSFKSPHAKLWLDFRARSKDFRNDRQFAHTWPWRRRVEAGKAEVAEKDRGGWLPIETAPRDGTVILAMLTDSDIPQSVLYQKGWRIHWDGYYLSGYDGPTHWQPLPKPPQEG